MFPARIPALLSHDLDAIAFREFAAAALVLDRDLKIVSANRSAEGLFAPLSLVGHAWMTLVAGWSVSPEAAATRHGPVMWPDAPFRLRAADGRILDATMRELPDGEGFVVTLIDVTGYVATAEAAQLDELTGFHKRQAMLARISEASSLAARRAGSFAVLCLDLDRFKIVNDTLGHPVGDTLLKKVAGRIAKACRSEDFVARLGGDEFAILQAGIEGPGAAQALAARLVDLLSRTYVLQGHTLNIGVSIGIALWTSDRPDAETLLRNGDIALYRAKSDGRGRFCFFEPGMDERMQTRRALEVDLRRALALKEFSLVYQPQVDLRTNAIVGFEALLRWTQPERGKVPPLDFIPLAEETGLIVAIGEWVIRTACREAASWSRSASIAVNVSPVQFRHAGLVDTVVQALAQSGLPASRLELEITEGALMENTDSVLVTLYRLRELGVRISMDDFGTGYSSLSYLQKFPFDKIKIDQSFTRGAEGNADCEAILKAVAGLGISLGIKTTAEGVETAEQMERIRNEGCHEVQGYFTGRPAIPEDIPMLLTN